MKKLSKILTVFVFMCIAFLISIGTHINVYASELTSDDVLINAGFDEDLVSKLSDYTKDNLAYQVLNEEGFGYEVMSMSETDTGEPVTRGQIPDDDLFIIITTSIAKVEDNKVKEIKVKVYYEWTDNPFWRTQDPIVVNWDNEKLEYKAESFHAEDRYITDDGEDKSHIKRDTYFERNNDTLCWYADLKVGSLVLYGFGEFTLSVKEDYQSYGSSILGVTYVHSKMGITVGISVYAEVGCEIPGTNNDQMSTDIGFNWNMPLLLTPADYGFEQQYFFYEKTLDIVSGNETITTTRLRCGYIEEEYINLSPRRLNAGEAYLVYTFDSNLIQVNVDLTLWSASEYLNPSDSTALIQYKDSNGNWITVLDLLNDVTLSKNRANPDTFTINFTEETNEFRFYVSSTATGDRNKGRLCIGDMEIFIER